MLFFWYSHDSLSIIPVIFTNDHYLRDAITSPLQMSSETQRMNLYLKEYTRQHHPCDANAARRLFADLPNPSHWCFACSGYTGLVHCLPPCVVDALKLPQLLSRLPTTPTQQDLRDIWTQFQTFGLRDSQGLITGDVDRNLEDFVHSVLSDQDLSLQALLGYTVPRSNQIEFVFPIGAPDVPSISLEDAIAFSLQNNADNVPKPQKIPDYFIIHVDREPRTVIQIPQFVNLTAIDANENHLFEVMSLSTLKSRHYQSISKVDETLIHFSHSNQPARVIEKYHGDDPEGNARRNAWVASLDNLVLESTTTIFLRKVDQAPSNILPFLPSLMIREPLVPPPPGTRQKKTQPPPANEEDVDDQEDDLPEVVYVPAEEAGSTQKKLTEGRSTPEFALRTHPENARGVNVKDLPGVDPDLHGTLFIDPTGCSMHNSSPPEKVVEPFFVPFLRNLKEVFKHQIFRNNGALTNAASLRSHLNLEQDTLETGTVLDIANILISFLHDCQTSDSPVVPTPAQIKNVLETQAHLEFSEEEVEVDDFSVTTFKWDEYYSRVSDIVDSIYSTRKTLIEVRKAAHGEFVRRHPSKASQSTKSADSEESAPSTKKIRMLKQSEYTNIHRDFILSYLISAGCESLNSKEFVRQYHRQKNPPVTEKRLCDWLKDWKRAQREDNIADHQDGVGWEPKPMGGTRKSAETFNQKADHCLLTIAIVCPFWTVSEITDYLNLARARNEITSPRMFTESCVTTELARFSFEMAAAVYCPPQRNDLGHLVARVIWAREMLMLKDDQNVLLAFIDESALYENMFRSRGRTLPGLCPNGVRNCRSNRSNMITCVIPGFGTLSANYTGKGIKSDKYSHFVGACIDVIRGYIDSRPDTLICFIQDNVGMHDTKKVRKIYREKGAVMIPTVTYSPQTNDPVESFFHFEKGNIIFDSSGSLVRGGRPMKDIIGAWDRIAARYDIDMSARYYLHWLSILDNCSEGVPLTQYPPHPKVPEVDEDQLIPTIDSLRFRRVYRRVASSQ